MISDTKKFIFIHIQRTGGSSIELSLSQYSNHPIGTLNVNETQFDTFLGGKNWIKHETLSYYLTKYPQCIDYYKFTIVRNPWDRIVSIYSFLKQSDPDGGDPKVREFARENSFTDWLLNLENSFYSGFAVPQSDFISDNNGKIAIDFIGKYENIETDFTDICADIGVNAELVHINKTRHEQYRDYYNDETKNIIEKIFLKDINNFNYTF